MKAEDYDHMPELAMNRSWVPGVLVPDFLRTGYHLGSLSFMYASTRIGKENFYAGNLLWVLFFIIWKVNVSFWF
jgi:hypothetical protein